jgi:hypothetical protein
MKTAFVKVTRPFNPQIDELPQFKITNDDLFNLAVEKEVIYDDAEYKIEVYYYDRNYFTFPEDYDPKKSVFALQLEFLR